MARFPSSVLGPLTAFDMSAYGNFMLSVARGRSLGLFALALSRPTAQSVAAPSQSVEKAASSRTTSSRPLSHWVNAVIF